MAIESLATKDIMRLFGERLGIRNVSVIYKHFRPANVAVYFHRSDRPEVFYGVEEAKIKLATMYLMEKAKEHELPEGENLMVKAYRVYRQTRFGIWIVHPYVAIAGISFASVASVLHWIDLVFSNPDAVADLAKRINDQIRSHWESHNRSQAAMEAAARKLKLDTAIERGPTHLPPGALSLTVHADDMELVAAGHADWHRIEVYSRDKDGQLHKYIYLKEEV